MSWQKIVSIGTVAFILFFTLLTPIGLISPHLPLPTQLQLGQVRGQLWSGNISALTYEQYYIQNIQWELNPWALLLGKVSGKVTFGEAKNKQNISGQGEFSRYLWPSSLTLSEFTLRLPAQLLAQKLPLPLPVSLQGRVLLTIDDYLQDQPYCADLEAEVTWQNAKINAMNNSLPLGGLAGKLSCQQGNIALTVNEENALGLQLEATLNKEQQLSAKGFVKPNAELPTVVHESVKFLGRPDQQGRYPISW